MLDDLRLAIALRGALRPEDRRVYEQELQEWELAPGFCSALLRLYASPPAQFGVPERLLAVLCLKNAVARRWQHRGVDEGSGGLADSEKAAVRAALPPAPPRSVCKTLLLYGPAGLLVAGGGGDRSLWNGALFECACGVRC